MKRRLYTFSVLLSTLLLLLTVSLWTLSYWRAGLIGRWHATWTPTMRYSNCGTAIFANQGRFALLLTHVDCDFDSFSPQNWSALTPEAQRRFLAFQAEHPEFHGWHVAAGAPSPCSSGKTLYNSLFGFAWERLPPGHDNLDIHVPAWLPAALLALLPAHYLRRRKTAPAGHVPTLCPA